MKAAAGLAYREAIPDGEPHGTVLLLHGYPESSYMWRHLLPAVVDAGWHAVAPDLAGFGGSEPDRPAVWTRHVESIERFRDELGLDGVVLLTHDWGGLIGLRWACDHPGHVAGLVISGTGFFTDGRWHGFAEALRTEGQGEQLIDAMTRDGLAALLEQSGLATDDELVDEYWRGFGDRDRRHSHLDFFRSVEFSELADYEGCLAALGVPALVLWGEDDPFAPVGGAYRFERDLPDAELVVVDGASHFVFEDAPDRSNRAVVSFLDQLT